MSSDGYEARLLTYLQSGGDQIRISSPFLNGQASVRNPQNAVNSEFVKILLES